ncbi:MAG: hypothetical protein ACPGOV_10610 [Magnetovibrionaceae bacterium]
MTTDKCPISESRPIDHGLIDCDQQTCASVLQAVASKGPVGIRIDQLAEDFDCAIGEMGNRLTTFIQRGFLSESPPDVDLTAAYEGSIPWPWVRLTPQGAAQLAALLRAQAI